MGIEIAVTRIKGEPVVEIPDKYVRYKIRYEPEEKPISREFITKSGGRNRVMIKIGWDKETRLKPGKPILMAFRNPGRPWSYIKGGVPINEPNFWYETVDQYFYRAEIDSPYVRHYKILPGAEISLIFKTMITLPVYYITVNNLGIDYDAEWDARTKSYWWDITPKNMCYDAVVTGLNSGASPTADVHIENDNVIADIIFSSFSGKLIADKIGRCYRYMVVRNFSVETELSDYPVNAEIRATYITICPRDWYQEPNNFMGLGEALMITVRNLQAWFTVSFQKSMKPKGSDEKVIDDFTNDIMFGNRQLFRRDALKNPIASLGRMKLTRGYTEPQKIHPSILERETPFYKCIKYVRIDIPKFSKEYDNNVIVSKLTSKIKKLEFEGKISEGLIYFDNKGFLWLKQQ